MFGFFEPNQFEQTTQSTAIGGNLTNPPTNTPVMSTGGGNKPKPEREELLEKRIANLQSGCQASWQEAEYLRAELRAAKEQIEGTQLRLKGVVGGLKQVLEVNKELLEKLGLNFDQAYNDGPTENSIDLLERVLKLLAAPGTMKVDPERGIKPQAPIFEVQKQSEEAATAESSFLSAQSTMDNETADSDTDTLATPREHERTMPNLEESMYLKTPTAAKSASVHGRDPNKSGLACLCGKTFASGSRMQKHFQYYSSTVDKRYSCTKCSARFFWPSYLRRHMKVVHKVSETSQLSMVCTGCKATFDNRSDLMRHIHLAHFSKFSAKAMTPQAKVSGAMRVSLRRKSASTMETSGNSQLVDEHPSKMVATPQSHKCNTCHKTFGKLKSLNQHSRLAHKDLSKEETDDKKGVHHAKDSKNVNACVCGRKFGAAHGLYHHLMYYSPAVEKRFSCDTCNQRFSWPYELRRHVANEHPGQQLHNIIRGTPTSRRKREEEGEEQDDLVDPLIRKRSKTTETPAPENNAVPVKLRSKWVADWTNSYGGTESVAIEGKEESSEEATQVSEENKPPAPP